MVLNLQSSVWQHLLVYLLNRMNQQQQRRNISLVNDGMSHLVKSTIAASFQILPCLSPSLLVDNEVCSLSGTISEVNVEEEDGVGGE